MVTYFYIFTNMFFQSKSSRTDVLTHSNDWQTRLVSSVWRRSKRNTVWLQFKTLWQGSKVSDLILCKGQEQKKKFTKSSGGRFRADQEWQKKQNKKTLISSCWINVPPPSCFPDRVKDAAEHHTHRPHPPSLCSPASTWIIFASSRDRGVMRRRWEARSICVLITLKRPCAIF